MGIDVEMATTETKGKWKKTVKEQIEKEFINETEMKEEEMKELRHGEGFGKMGINKVTKT